MKQMPDSRRLNSDDAAKSGDHVCGVRCLIARFKSRNGCAESVAGASQIVVNVHVGSVSPSPAEQGRKFAEAIKAYERTTGQAR